uniref:Uncharacterized protein n=1 Tax=Romanomermis culicivorax TaxID=13658 RepID=A0A915K4H6_ROMCU
MPLEEKFQEEKSWGCDLKSNGFGCIVLGFLRTMQKSTLISCKYFQYDYYAVHAYYGSQLEEMYKMIILFNKSVRSSKFLEYCV